MIVHRSNRTEALVAVLGDIVAKPLEGPFAPELIVVQGRGMERWLAMQLAERFGIWANPEFLYPHGMVERILRAVLSRPETEDDAFAPETLQWTIAGLLPDLLERPDFAPIASYLAGDDPGRMRIQLSQRIAATFSNYLTYRPEMILDWECDEAGEGDWQAQLWRSVVAQQGGDHLAARAREAGVALESIEGPVAGLPDRVSVFGVSALPPLYLSLLSGVSRLMDTHLFVLSPSREYWADIRSPREQHAIEGRAPEVDPELLHLESGHPLLGSLGRLGREFQQTLVETGDGEQGEERYAASSEPAGSMLATLQDDMLHLRHRGAPEAEVEALALDPGDESFRLHACHSPMREVEVLRDELLACFEADPTLEPRDVIVMTPDIEAYTPFIEAVFDAGGRDTDVTRGEGLGRREGEIPHRIADRGPDATSAVAEVLRRGLDLLEGRFKAAEVSDLLGIESVREKLELEADDLEPLRAWMAESGIRWGVDAAHRVSLEQPARSENTWRFGIDRLLLGYASPDTQDVLFGGVLPLAGVEGRSAERLGRLLDLCEKLFHYREIVKAPRTPGAWRDTLVDLLRELVTRNDDNAHEHALVCDVLARVARSAEVGGFEGEIPLASMREQIELGLEQARRPTRFLTGGVTFCQLVPMRSIPFRVVCLLGMNDESFPRIRRPLGFDWIARARRPGDRSTRDDDHYLFLEALLSARERLVISYVGQSIRDGSSLPPSVVVSELLDVLGESFEAPRRADEDARDAIRRALVTEHPLQPFSPRYFGAKASEGLFSYSALHLDAARRLEGERQARAPLVATPLVEPEPGPDESPAREVALDDLVAFFRNPVKHFLQHRLALRVADEEEEIPERESAELAGLERWRVGSEMLGRTLAGETREAIHRSLRAAGALPLGASGRVQFEGIAVEVDAIARRARLARGGEKSEMLEVDLAIDDTRIRGRLTGLWPGGLVEASYTRIGGSAELGLWVRHLCLDLVRKTTEDAGANAAESFLFGRVASGAGAAGVKLAPVDDAKAILSQLLAIHRLGHSEPLPLFERSSRAYAQSLHDRGDPAIALAQGRKSWEDSRFSRGESVKPWALLAFGDLEPFAADACSATGVAVADLAEGVWLPVLERVEALP